jgi:transmembrane sensor
MTTENPNLPNDSREAAAYWFARVHSGNFTVAERERFKRWRRASPSNEQEYRALDEIWQATNLLPEDDLRELLDAPEPPTELRRMARRRWLIGAGSVCTAAVAGSVLIYGQMLEAPTHVTRYATAHGEQRSEALPDGSVIEMNVSTELVVRYYAKRRSVELLHGEASFEVAANPDQPFFVDAGTVDVRVTGTVFNVRREQDQVSVAVQSGSVEVTSGHWWNREKAMLTAGMTTQAQPGLPMSVAQADVVALTAWRQGKVVFKDQPLEDMVREMNRYLVRPIRLTDSRLKRLRMAGVFTIQDADGFLQALQSNLPIAVVWRPDGGADLSLLR